MKSCSLFVEDLSHSIHGLAGLKMETLFCLYFPNSPWTIQQDSKTAIVIQAEAPRSLFSLLAGLLTGTMTLKLLLFNIDQ